MDRDEVVRQARADWERKTFFTHTMRTAAVHWFFTQGQQALENELYVPGVSSLINGIEASLRVIVTELSEEYGEDLQLSPRETLNNILLRKARDVGLPVGCLAYPDEANFMTDLNTNRPNVKIVQLRHDICHGNILEFAPYFDGETRIFTPECLRPEAARLLDMSYRWSHGVAYFLRDHGWIPADETIPDIPENPLAVYLPT